MTPQPYAYALRLSAANDRREALLYALAGCPPHERNEAWSNECALRAREVAHAYRHLALPYAYAMREYTLALKGAATIRRPGFRLVYGKAEVRTIHRQCLERAQQKRDCWSITRRLPQ